MLGVCHMVKSPRRIAVTMGDPAGVGPEFRLDLLAEGIGGGEYIPIVFGDGAVLER